MNAKSMEQTLVALRQMTVGQLREQYQQVFEEPTNAGNKDFLFKRIAWRIQSNAEGSLSERARRRAEELARDADIRTSAPRAPKREDNDGMQTRALAAPRMSSHDRLPLPGTVLTRMYRGTRIEVKVLTSAFEYDGQTYRSLSAIAKALTGSHWNGLLFFGLTPSKKDVSR